MDIKSVNIILADYMKPSNCQCMIYSTCPSPSAHHEFCLNENCRKKITDDTYETYSNNLNKLNRVWLRLIQEENVKVQVDLYKDVCWVRIIDPIHELPFDIGGSIDSYNSLAARLTATYIREQGL